MTKENSVMHHPDVVWDKSIIYAYVQCFVLDHNHRQHKKSERQTANGLINVGARTEEKEERMERDNKSKIN